MSRSFRVGVAQMCSGADISANLAIVERLAQKAADVISQYCTIMELSTTPHLTHVTPGWCYIAFVPRMLCKYRTNHHYSLNHAHEHVA